MNKLLIVAVAGALAQLVDGALGMGFGITATTCMMTIAALGPAQASAIVHAAELGTTLASGASHWKFGNVQWGTALRLGVPGALGAFLGASVLSRISLAAAAPVTAGILTFVGALLVWRFSRGRVQRTIRMVSPRFLGTLGFFAGFLDSSGGGGWGPLTSTTLLGATSQEPRKIIGTVNTSEFLVTAAASIGFALGLWPTIVAHVWSVLALLLGGVLAAPLGAYLVSRLNPSLLGGFVGTTLMTTNALKVFPHWVAALLFLSGAALSVLGYLRAQATLKAAPEDVRQKWLNRMS
ncbi:Sulfite exporter TauE/SafE [Corynebacterium kalinowskii]|uniref:Probable membrane transporter protein n=1 Tax=Corynebacterium kalinowskii TaxID=2675216 RepID=A0A6B8V8W6_9CORY|nr:sulfite exporter TauE/SafE family protein [Corynebacterium kalinowskii]QGU01502.1 Sulfite exporter TauE/SafE [Corynebacterium kalinowskii]